MKLTSALCLSISLLACNGSGKKPEPVQPSIGESKDPTALRDGDIVFHESTSRQSDMVRALTGSKWTHMGVVFLEPAGPMVFEAVSPVGYTSFTKWTARGKGQRYVVKRLRDSETRLSQDRLQKMRNIGRGWLGRPYDLQFRWSDESMYCSELVYKLFDRGAGIRIGREQQAKDMNLSDQRVKSARQSRFAKGGFDPEETVVSPGSMFEDEQLVTVLVR